MPLRISVGLLAAEIGADSIRADVIGDDFERLNMALEAVGLPPHMDPESLDSAASLVWELPDHSHLHLLRRIAARAALGAGLPEPLADAGLADEDEVVDLYYDRGGTPIAPGFLGFVASFFWRRRAVYQHLMFHGDTAGFYLPRDFENVIITEDRQDVPGGIVGSAPRLLEECRDLAERLDLPPDFELADLDRPWTSEEGEEEPPAWPAHREAAGCLVVLRSACRQAALTGAAVYFD